MARQWLFDTPAGTLDVYKRQPDSSSSMRTSHRFFSTRTESSSTTIRSCHSTLVTMRSLFFPLAIITTIAGSAVAAPAPAFADVNLVARQYQSYRGGSAYSGNSGNVNGGNVVVEGSRSGTITNSGTGTSTCFSFCGIRHCIHAFYLEIPAVVVGPPLLVTLVVAMVAGMALAATPARETLALLVVAA